MPKDENASRRRFLSFGDLKAWAVPRLRAIVEESGLQGHQDTLDRLLQGSFADLTPAARAERVEEIIRTSAMAAMGMASMPVPFLDIPVLVAMVSAIGRVHGLNQGDNKLYLQVVGTLGGGLAVRQILRMVPFGSQLYLSQIYGATWALGLTANHICATGGTPQPNQVRALFEETLRRKAEEHQKRAKTQPAKAPLGPEARLLELQGLREKNLISQDEYDRKRAEILAQV
jgi:uncharacterized protein (DUF697 family)